MSESRGSAKQRQSDVSVQSDNLAAQNELAAFAAHDLRGPLSTLEAFLSILLSEQPGPLNEIQRDFVSSMFFVTRRLERLTHDIQVLLNDGEGFSVSLQQIDLMEIAEECLRELAPISEAFGVTPHIDADKSKTWETMSDPVRVTQIMINLLENAIRHATRETVIVLRLRQSSTRMLLVVQNHAAHLPPQDIEHWFAPYVRGTGARERAPQGLGLGLALVSHLVAALKGQLFTRTRGREVTIAVRLPYGAMRNVSPQ